MPAPPLPNCSNLPVTLQIRIQRRCACGAVLCLPWRSSLTSSPQPTRHPLHLFYYSAIALTYQGRRGHSQPIASTAASNPDRFSGRSRSIAPGPPPRSEGAGGSFSKSPANAQQRQIGDYPTLSPPNPKWQQRRSKRQQRSPLQIASQPPRQLQQQWVPGTSTAESEAGGSPRQDSRRFRGVVLGNGDAGFAGGSTGAAPSLVGRRRGEEMQDPAAGPKRLGDTWASGLQLPEGSSTRASRQSPQLLESLGSAPPPVLDQPPQHQHQQLPPPQELPRRSRRPLRSRRLVPYTTDAASEYDSEEDDMEEGLMELLWSSAQRQSVGDIFRNGAVEPADGGATGVRGRGGGGGGSSGRSLAYYMDPAFGIAANLRVSAQPGPGGIEVAAALAAATGAATGTDTAHAAQTNDLHQAIRRAGGYFQHKAQLLAPLFQRRLAKNPVTLARLEGMSEPYTNATALATARLLSPSPSSSVAESRDGDGIGMPYRYGIGARGQIIDLVRQARVLAPQEIPERVRQRMLAAARRAAGAAREVSDSITCNSGDDLNRKRSEAEQAEEDDDFESDDVDGFGDGGVDSEGDDAIAESSRLDLGLDLDLDPEDPDLQAVETELARELARLVGVAPDSVPIRAAAVSGLARKAAAGIGSWRRRRQEEEDAQALFLKAMEAYDDDDNDDSDDSESDGDDSLLVEDEYDKDYGLPGDFGIKEAKEDEDLWPEREEEEEEGRGRGREPWVPQGHVPAGKGDGSSAWDAVRRSRSNRSMGRDTTEAENGGGDDYEDDEDVEEGEVTDGSLGRRFAPKGFPEESFLDPDENAEDEEDDDDDDDSNVEALLEELLSFGEERRRTPTEATPGLVSESAPGVGVRAAEAAAARSASAGRKSGIGDSGGTQNTSSSSRGGGVSAVGGPEAAASATNLAAVRSAAATVFRMHAPGGGGDPRNGVKHTTAASSTVATSVMDGSLSNARKLSSRPVKKGVEGEQQVQQQVKGGYLGPPTDGWHMYGVASSLAAAGSRTAGASSSPESRTADAKADLDVDVDLVDTAATVPKQPLALRAFLYCIGRNELYNALWCTDLMDRLEFVNRLRDADVVIHRSPAPGERQFALEDLRTGARRASIPFISVRQASEQELVPALERMFRRFEEMCEKVVSAGPEETAVAAGTSRPGAIPTASARTPLL